MGYVRTDRPQHIYEPPYAPDAPIVVEDRRTTRIFTGGSTAETVGGFVAAVIALIGLTGHRQIYMLGVASITAGIALFAQGSSIAARWQDVLRRLEGDRFDRSELIGGVGTEVFGGAVGIVLGVLALADVRPFTLLPVAAIVFGGSLLLGGAAQPDIEELVPDYDARHRRITRNAIHASGGVMVLVGIAASVLGILALLEVGPVLTLSLVAMLGVGAALLMAGSALTARFVRRFA
jgi:hypothetical protein